MEHYNLIVDKGENLRLDVFISNNIESISRNQVKNLIKDKLILVNNNYEKPSYKVSKNDNIDIKLPIEEKLDLISENIPIEIIYEDDSICVVNKPIGMVVHPSPGHNTGTLVNALLYNVDKLSNINGELRPGIVHRLDRDTSGVLVVAKDNDSHIKLLQQFKNRTVERKYNALVHGRVSKMEGIINAPIGRHEKNRQKMAVIKSGREAISMYKVLERFDKYTFMEIELKTGRTHQIRVHMNYLNYPIVGDQVYSSGRNEFGLKEQFLHARKLSFKHPKTNEKVSFEAEIPKKNKKIIESLKNKRRIVYGDKSSYIR